MPAGAEGATRCPLFLSLSFFPFQFRMWPFWHSTLFRLAGSQLPWPVTHIDTSAKPPKGGWPHSNLAAANTQWGSALWAGSPTKMPWAKTGEGKGGGGKSVRHSIKCFKCLEHISKAVCYLCEACSICWWYVFVLGEIRRHQALRLLPWEFLRNRSPPLCGQRQPYPVCCRDGSGQTLPARTQTCG